MDITVGYAIVVGGMLLIPVFINIFFCLPSPLQVVFNRALRYLKYPYLIHRHKFLGPWTLEDVIIQLIYIASNSFCLGFRVPSIEKAGSRAGILSLINLIPLFLGPHLSFLADLLGVSLRTFRHVHRFAGLMSTALIIFHAIVIASQSTTFILTNAKNFSAIIGGSSLGIIILASSWPPFRSRFYEIFLRLHHILAATIAISVLLHIPSTFIPRIYFYIGVGIFIITSTVEGWLLLYYNGIFTFTKGKEMTTVGEIFKYPYGDGKGPVQLTIISKKSLNIKAGQYVNICIPSLSLWSFMQSHPFVVTSWTGEQTTKLELVIEPRRGWTKRLHSRAISASGENGGLGMVLLTGPHGAVVPVGDYEFVFMIASGYGIVAHLPLLERLVQGTLAREVRAHRISLAWEFEDIGLYKAVYPLFNWILGEDGKLGDNCTLAISLYTRQLASVELGQRAQIFETSISLKNVFETEILEVDKRQREENKAVAAMEKQRAREKTRGRVEIIRGINQETAHESHVLPVFTRRPRMLITVSASRQIRDELRSELRVSLDKEITLAELDFQPVEEYP